MSGRQLKSIFGVLAGLLILYGAVRLLGGNRTGPGDGADIGGAVGTDVDLIRVRGPGEGDSVRLARSGDSWTVNGYPADTSLVREAIDGLDTARAGRLVARSASNHARLGVSEDSTRSVSVGPATDPDVEFYLGRGGPDGRYVRFPGGDDVFTVAPASVRSLSRGVDEWRDRLIAAVDTGSVIRILIRRRDEAGERELNRVAIDTAVVWQENEVPVDTAAVQGLLRTAADLRASGFPSDPVAFAVDFEEPSGVLEMFDSDELGAAPALSLLFLTAPDARDFLVRRADDPLVFRLETFNVERLLPERATLFPGE